MTTREHLREFHQRSAAHHVQMAKAHKKVAAHYAKAEGMDGAEVLADHHNAMADALTGMAEYHLTCCEKLMGKAMGVGGDDDGDRPVPMPGISTVYNLVPRHGAPLLGRDLVDTSSVRPEFRDLVKVEDDEL